MCPFLDEASYWAEKFLTDINLHSLMPDETNNFGGSYVLDFRKCHMQPKIKSDENGQRLYTVIDPTSHWMRE